MQVIVQTSSSQNQMSNNLTFDLTFDDVIMFAMQHLLPVFHSKHEHLLELRTVQVIGSNFHRNVVESNEVMTQNLEVFH